MTGQQQKDLWLERKYFTDVSPLLSVRYFPLRRRPGYRSDQMRPCSPLRRETVWMTRAIVTVTVGGPGARESLRSTGGRPHCPSLHMLGWLSTMAANKTDAGNNHHHDFHPVYHHTICIYIIQ